MYADKVLTCADCGQEFVFTAREQEFYATRGFTEPRRCAVVPREPQGGSWRQRRRLRRRYRLREPQQWRLRRQRRRLRRRQRWRRILPRPPRDVHGDLLQLRQGGPGPLPPDERQARLLQRLLRPPARLSAGAETRSTKRPPACRRPLGFPAGRNGPVGPPRWPAPIATLVAIPPDPRLHWLARMAARRRVAPRGRGPMTEWLGGPARAARAVRVIAIRGGQAAARPDTIVGEEPMAIRVAGPDGSAPIAVAVTMRTPGHDAELAVGFLVTEGLITPGDVVRTTIGDVATLAQPENEITVHLARALDPAAISGRNFAATASCGICGKASLDEVTIRCDPPADWAGRDAGDARRASGRSSAAQAVFEADRRTPRRGAVRREGPAAPAARGRRAPQRARQAGGCGRAGRGAAAPRPGPARVGPGQLRDRAEGCRRRHPVVAAISAPTDLAVSTRHARLSMTLVGFLRGDGFNVYAGEDRVALG